MNRLIIITLALLVTACAGPNPNPGERTADTAWERNENARAFEVAKIYADHGHPWAQLRMGMYYDMGLGTPGNIDKALYWYKLAAKNNIEGKWAEGYIAGATGDAGYFGERNDTLIAQYRLSRLYLEGNRVEQDLVVAQLLSMGIMDNAKGNDMFFCCEWSGGRYFTLDMVITTIAEIDAQLSDQEREKINSLSETWSVQDL